MSKYRLLHSRPITDKKDLYITKQEVLDMYRDLKDKEVNGFVFGFKKVI